MVPIKVGVIGALGRMGNVVCQTVDGDPDMVLVGGADIEVIPDSDTRGVGNSLLVNSIPKLLEMARPDVVVDFTNGQGFMDTVRAAAPSNVCVVSGSTGVLKEDYHEIKQLIEQHHISVIHAPNFAIGAMLLEHLAAQAATHFDYVDLVENHHEAKQDAPSGTALSIAAAIGDARKERFMLNQPKQVTLEGVRGGDYHGISIHSVRMPGRVARHEVVFGARGQTLTMTHDSIGRESFMPGVLLAVKKVRERSGLTIGLATFLGLAK